MPMPKGGGKIGPANCRVTASIVTLRAISAAEIDGLIALETPTEWGLTVPPGGVDGAIVLRIVRDLTSRAAARGMRATV
jgi:hypothetical protein